MCIIELEDVLPIVELSGTSGKVSIMLSRLASGPEVGGCDSVEFR
jgi:hypothetical protein